MFIGFLNLPLLVWDLLRAVSCLLLPYFNLLRTVRNLLPTAYCPLPTAHCLLLLFAIR